MRDEIDELIRSRTNGELPADVEDRLRRRLVEFRTKVEQRPPSRLRAFAYSLIAPPAWRVMAMTAILLTAVAVGLVLMPRDSRASQVFAAAAAQLRNSQSLEYTIVLNEQPYVAVDFSYLAPGYRRIHCSWGIEIRTDGTTGKQIVLMQAAHTYLNESGKTVESQSNIDDFSAQLRSLPNQADDVLGERWTGQQKLVGYRLSKAPPNGSVPGLKVLDIWIDPATREVHHVDITVQEAGKPEHQMHIRNILVGQAVDRSLFDLTPPAGYSAIVVPNANPSPTSPQNTMALQAEIRQTGELVAVVVPMKGPYAQTSAALSTVQAYLKQQRTTPVGPPLGRYWSEDRWETGYPVQPGTQVEAPFQVVSLPAGLTASVVVNGPWGKDTEVRWGSFLKSVVEQGYVPAGPTMEIWSGDAGQGAQSTEMRIPVTKAN
jgi:outer membrane lipoprotein-sorting protein